MNEEYGSDGYYDECEAGCEAEESYLLIFKKQTEKAFLLGFATEEVWLPKSQIEINSEEDYTNFEEGEELDVVVPDWLAEKYNYFQES